MPKNQVALAGTGEAIRKNTVTAIISQNLSWVNKHGEAKTFEQVQEFSTDTMTEITSHKVGLWLACVLKQFVKLARLQNKTGFKLSKDVDVKLVVNGRTLHVKSNQQETVSFKFSLSPKRIENLLTKYPELVKEAFRPAPGMGGISTNVARAFMEGRETLVLAPAKKKVELQAPASPTKDEMIEVDGVFVPADNK